MIDLEKEFEKWLPVNPMAETWRIKGEGNE